MIKKIARLLEIGEKTRPEDKVYCDGHLLGVKCLSLVTKESNPIRRDTYVIELPEIPEGFRPVTKEDIENKAKGEFMFFSAEEGWIMSGALQANHLNECFVHIIKTKVREKGFTIQDVKPGMTFILTNAPYLRGGKVGLCSEYQG